MKKLFLVSLAIGFAIANSNCTTCHNGGMTSKLDVLTPQEIIKKMKEYKAKKGNPMMVNIAKEMSDKEIEEVAKEYGKKQNNKEIIKK